MTVAVKLRADIRPGGVDHGGFFWELHDVDPPPDPGIPALGVGPREGSGYVNSGWAFTRRGARRDIKKATRRYAKGRAHLEANTPESYEIEAI